MINRISHQTALGVGLALVWALAILNLPLSAQAQGSDCLRLGNTIVSPVSGETLVTGLPDVIDTLSPDGRFSVSREFDASGQFNSVILEARFAEESTIIGQNAAQVYWSDDSTYYAFLSSDHSHYSLTLGNVSDFVAQTIRIEPITQRPNLRLHGFSADSQYLGLTVTADGRSQIIFYRIPDLTPLAIEIGEVHRGITWSASGHNVGFVSGFEGSYEANVLSADGEWHVTYPSPTHSEFTHFLWSPDGTHAVAYHRALDDPQTVVVGRDGVLAEFDGIPASSAWVEDSSSVLVWQQIYDDLTYELVQFNVINRQSETIIFNVYRTYDLSEDGQLLVAPTWQDRLNDELVLTLFRLEAGTYHLIARLSPPEVYPGIRMYWPPVNHEVMLTYITDRVGSGLTTREIRLNTATLEAQTSEPYASISPPLWVNGGNAYVQSRSHSAAFEVVWIDTLTQKEKLLAENMTRIDLLSLDEGKGNFSYRWQDEAGQSGLDLFSSDGTRLRQ